MKTNFWIASSVAAVGLAGGAFLTSRNPLPVAIAWAAPGATVETEKAPTPVMAVTVQYRRVHSAQTLPGTIAPATASVLAFRVGGKVRERLVKLGDEVRAGDVIALLDDTDLRLKQEAAGAELGAARTALDKAEINLERVSRLKSDGWASNRASDDETVAVEEARARLLRAERNAELADNELSYATLRADGDSVVTEELAEAGQVVLAGQPIVKVALDGPRDAVVAVPEGMLANLRGDDVSVELWSNTGSPIQARLRQLSPIADPATRTFEARFALDDEGGRAKLGMSATVRLIQSGESATAELPLSALLFRQDGPVVWVVGPDGHLVSRPVSVSEIDSGTADISAGINDGDRVVVLGVHKLSEGDLVRPVEQEG